MPATWQYLSVTYANGNWGMVGPTAVVIAPRSAVPEMLKAVGEDGWELVSVPAEPYKDMWVFKRAVQE